MTTDPVVPQPSTGVTLPNGRVVGKRDGWVPPADDLTPVGARREFTNRVRALVETAGNQALEALAAPDAVSEYVDAIRAGVRARDRTALHIYAKQMKMIDQDKTITLEFYHRFGVKGEDELKRYVDAARSVEGAGPHDGAERCVAYLEAYLNAFPEQRGPAVKRLGGYVPVEAG